MKIKKIKKIFMSMLLALCMAFGCGCDFLSELVKPENNSQLETPQEPQESQQPQQPENGEEPKEPENGEEPKEPENSEDMEKPENSEESKEPIPEEPEDGRTIATFSEKVDILSMDGSTLLLTFKTMDFTSANHYKRRFFVNIIDVDNPKNVISVGYSDPIYEEGFQANGQTWVNVSYGGKTAEFTGWGAVMQAWGKDYYTLTFNGKEKTLSYDKGVATFDGDKLPTLRGFKNGAYVSFSANSKIEVGSQIFVTQIAGYEVYNGRLIKNKTYAEFIKTKQTDSITTILHDWKEGVLITIVG